MTHKLLSFVSEVFFMGGGCIFQAKILLHNNASGTVCSVGLQTKFQGRALYN